MEWVIALLAIGCFFLTFHIAMNYIKYKRLLKPKSDRLDATRQEMDDKIAAAQGQLEADREQLRPLRDEVNQIDAEFHQTREQVRQERARQRAAQDPPPSRDADGPPP